MLRRARRAASGSRSINSPATAAWMVDAVRVWPIESCSSCASRLRWARRRICSSTAASRSAGRWSRKTGASSRSAAAAPAQTATIAIRQPTAAATAHRPGIPERTLRVSPKLSTTPPPPSHTATNIMALNSNSPVSPVTSPPSAICGTSHAAVRSRFTHGLGETSPDAGSSGTGRSVPSRRFVSRTLLRRAPRGQAMATITTAHASVKPAMRSAVGQPGDANNSPVTTGTTPSIAPRSACPQAVTPRFTALPKGGRSMLRTVRSWQSAVRHTSPERARTAQ